MVVFNSILPEDKYCVKCGASECYIDKKEKLEFFDIEYAIISKKEVDNSIKHREILQIWIEKGDNPGEMLNNIRLIPLLIR